MNFTENDTFGITFCTSTNNVTDTQNNKQFYYVRTEILL